MLQLHHTLFYALDDGDGVSARLLDNGQRDRRVSVHRNRAVRIRAGVIDPSKIVDLDRVAVLIFDDDLAEAFDGGDLAQRAQRDGSSAFVQPAAGQLLILRADSGSNVVDSEVIRLKLIGVEINSDLARASAENLHIANTVNGLNSFLNLLGDKLGQIDHRTRLADGELNDRAGVRIRFLHDRRIGAFRQLAQGAAYLVANFLRGDLRILFQNKSDGDVRTAERGIRGHLIDAGDGVDRAFDHIGHLGFHFLGRRAGVSGLYRYGRQIDAGKAVYAQGKKRKAADDR